MGISNASRLNGLNTTSHIMTLSENVEPTSPDRMRIFRDRWLGSRSIRTNGIELAFQGSGSDSRTDCFGVSRSESVGSS